MRFYTQLVVWTYIVLPAICILLSPTLILGVAKAQQQRAKLMANAFAAKSKMAAAVARNNAKLYQKRIAPNHNVHNSHNFFPSAYPQQHRFRNIRDVSASAPFNWDVSKRSHWDQQDESMGVLQNMWNMNSFGNIQNGGVVRLTRNGNQQLNDVPFEETIVGSPRIYDNKQRKTIERIANTGPLFGGRNVYDAVVGQGNPLNNVIENFNEGAFNNNFEFGNEDFDETDFTGFSEDEEEFARSHRKNKKGHANHYYPQYNHYQDDKYNGHDYDFYKRNDADGGLISEDMISTDPNLKSYLPAEEQTEERSKKKRRGHHHHSYDYTYYGRNNANEELIPEEIIAGAPNSMSSLLAGAQAEERSSKNKGKGHHQGHVHYDRTSANESPVPEVPNMPPTEVQTSNYDQNQQVDQTPIISEDGAILGTFLNLPNQDMPTLDYQKAVEEVEEFNKKLLEATQRLAHPVVTPPSDIFQFAPEVPTFPEPFQPSLIDEKSASPDPDPHHHHLRGFSHTHTHTHSHDLRPLPPPPYPNEGFGHNEFGQHGFGQTSANANAFANSGFGSPHGGFVPQSGGFSQVDALSKSGFGGGFGQAQASSQAQALSKTGYGGGFGNSQANAQAISQSASSGFGGAASQAIAQANEASHAGPQFFQVLGPSNFVNARSKEGATIPQPQINNEFMMPHLEEIPVDDVMHEINQKLEGQAENETPFSTTFQTIPSIAETLSQNAKIQDNKRESQTRFKRSAEPQDSRSDIFSGLNLASGIVHSALDLSSKLPSSRKLVKNPNENHVNIMNSIGGIVNSGLAAGEPNIDDQEFETDQDDEALKEVTPLTDIVNMDLKNNGAHKRVHRSLKKLDEQDVFTGLNLASGIVQSSIGLSSKQQQSPRETSDSIEDDDGEDLTKELIALHSKNNTKSQASEVDTILELNPELNEEDDEASIIEMAKDILKTHEASKQMKRFPRRPANDALDNMAKVTQMTEKSLETQTDAPCQVMSNAHSAQKHQLSVKVNGKGETQRLNSNIVGATIVSKPDSKEVADQNTSQSPVKKTTPNYDHEMIERINPDNDQGYTSATETLTPIFDDSESSAVLDLHKNLEKTDATKPNSFKKSDLGLSQSANDQQVVSMMNPEDMHQENTPNLTEALLKEGDISRSLAQDSFDLHNKIEGIDTTKHMTGGTSFVGLPHLKVIKQITEKETSSHEKVQMMNPDDFPQVNQPTFTYLSPQVDHVTESFVQGSLDLHKQFEETDSNKHHIGQTSFVGMPLLKDMNKMVGQDKSDHEVIQMINPDDFPEQNQPMLTESPPQEDHVSESVAQENLDLHKQFEEADLNKYHIGQTSFVGMPLLKDINKMVGQDKSDHEVIQMINPDDFPQQNQPTFTESPPQIDHVSESVAQENLDLHKQFEDADSNKHNIGGTSFVGMPQILGSIHQMSDMPRGSSHEIISTINPDDIEREQSLKNTEVVSKEDNVFKPSSQENPITQFEKTDAANLNSNDGNVLGMPPPSESMRDNESEESKELSLKSDKSSKESSEEQHHVVTPVTIINTSTIVPSVVSGHIGTTLTPDEIEEIQFGMPDEEVINESTTFGEVEDYESKVVEPSEASTESSLAVNTTGITEASTELPMVKADQSIKEEVHNSTNPLASVEEEMNTLTDEQKQEFLKQEEQLIADILAAAGVNYDGFLKPKHGSQSSKGDQTVASPNLLDTFEDRRSNWINEHSSYYRNARSPMEDRLDSILGTQREHLSNIQKDATGDDDLLMISKN